ncbi:uncharacterized protein LOC126896832 isoform X2 [Daktulosphaira vitifoliae]|uniref:uncharacterized protein LOC126896832 isoform X2 n=1 Tax=Daktulosphaira vitifoliae TaxID=58002 RepID=UPI0021A9C8E8|nr:uncharacterized protein LOC126896832 isoform X2 [Daktulosphaira vitifoliae]
MISIYSLTIDTEIPSIEYYPNVISNDNCEVPSYSKTDTYIIDKNEILEHVESVDENKKISTHETVNYNKYILQPSPNSCQYELYVSVQGESPIQKNYWIDKRKHCPSLKLYQSPQSSNGLSIPVQPVSKKCYCASTKEERKRFSDICRLQNLINNKKTDFKQINRLILSVLVELEKKDIIVDKIFFN